jgi:hypothetical protein
MKAKQAVKCGEMAYRGSGNGMFNISNHNQQQRMKTSIENKWRERQAARGNGVAERKRREYQYRHLIFINNVTSMLIS